ncbi:MAG TPA: serpin family protein [Gemmatimonadaceae bacterium]|nr:serpin family protein [Gemmatimonadaceae bacterium]
MPRIPRPLLLLSALVACGGSTEPGTQPHKLEALPRTLTAAESKVLGAANAFSFALFDRLSAAQPGENVFVSPLSASFALGMTLNGAAGQTYTEMQSALQFAGTSLGDINAGYRSIIALLTSLDPAVKMQIANSIWYRKDFAFTQAFFDTTKTYFAAKVAPLDFSDITGSLTAINGWVNASTGGKIPTIVDAINPQDVMFLINAIYFNGGWRDKFDTHETRDDTFQPPSGPAQTVKLMHKLDTLSYAESDAWQAVDLPYGNAAFTMTVVLPKPGTNINAFAASLSASTWQSIASSFQAREIDLTLPRLKLEYERTLNDDLKALGMNVPFVGDVADFTRMSPAGNHLYISFVKQKTYVDVNEAGTEAAAATAVGISVTSAPIIPEMHVNRPYIFIIREHLSGTILFMGKVTRIPS